MFYIMIRTQIQLPDSLYHELKRVAKAREWSLAEAMRRGAEYVVQTFPPTAAAGRPWRLPDAVDLGLTSDPFADPDWREEASLGGPAAKIMARRLREAAARYEEGS